MILVAYGTRPEKIKVDPLINMLPKGKYKTVFTGQHTSLLENSEFDYKLEIENGDNRLDSIVRSCLNVKNIWDGITHVLVQGDTTSAFAMALAAFHRNIKIIHLEAGLRTYDLENPFPEEANRGMISKMADIHLCPTVFNAGNLAREGADQKRVFVVGNTGLDSIAHLREKIRSDKKILITLHRRENHDTIDKWFEVIDKLASKYKEYEFVLPIHPNPNVKKHAHILKNVKAVEPMDRDELLDFLVTCSLVITDSGGIQEECSFFDKPALVCRKVTERPESVGITSFLVDINSLDVIFDYRINNLKFSSVWTGNKCPYGDGKSSEKIIKIFSDEKII
jgi:UDP-N-acetylglucosamine 2-epimerase (non-hydrolysing)